MRLHRRHFLQGAVAAVPGFAFAAPPAGEDWRALAADVKAEMKWAWAQYREHAWGQDQIKPVSGGAENFFLPGHPLGLSIVEALDTLWVMGLDAEFEDGVKWCKDNLRFDIDGEVQVFETSIRLTGGLLSAHHACGDPRLLELCHDLTERMLPAFARSPTAMPYRFVNLRTGAVRDHETYPAEIGSYFPEYATLSKLTGDTRFHDRAKAATGALFERRSKLDLLADTIDIETGAWKSRRATIGPPSDSFYEYLWDGWQLLADADHKRWYDVLTAAILKHQPVTVDGRLWFAQVDFETGAVLDHRSSELASFYGGLLGQGGAMKEGRAYTLSWAAVQDRYGILPEGFDYQAFAPTRPSNALRPELADSAFNLWLLDRDPIWRRIGATHYRNMKAFNRTNHGYSGLTDLTKRTLDDSCPGYWWSEQMKYYFLLFSDTPRFDYQDNYLSTEGNVLKGFKRT